MMNGQRYNQLSCSSATGRKINRIELFFTTRILLHILSKENPKLRIIAQKVLRDSYKCHQTYPEETCLASLIETGLREVVGEYWYKANGIRRQWYLSFKDTPRIKQNISCNSINE